MIINKVEVFSGENCYKIHLYHDIKYVDITPQWEHCINNEGDKLLLEVAEAVFVDGLYQEVVVDLKVRGHNWDICIEYLKYEAVVSVYKKVKCHLDESIRVSGV